MNRALICTNQKRDVDLSVSRSLAQILLSNGIQPYADNGLAKAIGALPMSRSAKPDMAFVLGGDGTILRAVHSLSRRGIPLLGVHMGKLGFLTEVLPKELDMAVKALLEGQYDIEERGLLRGTAFGPDGQPKGRSLLALNELALLRASMNGLLQVGVKVNGQLLGAYGGDGLMIATPTGSTAYSLSAGGPIVEPSVACMLITPICAHTLHARPVIVPDDVQIELWPQMPDENALVYADGQNARKIAYGDCVNIQKADYTAKFIRLRSVCFFAQWHEKLSEWNRPMVSGEEELA